MRLYTLAGALTAVALFTAGLATELPARPLLALQAKAQAGHQRLLPLEGGQNFRDLGGYRTTNGKTVRWRVLFRSGTMSDLTANDFAYLQKLGIRTVCDFRSTSERATAPVRWPGSYTPKVFADDYKLDMGGIDFSKMGSWTADEAIAQMSRTYPSLLENFNGQYRRMFEQLLAGNGPLAFNCSAGKDRTGIAAALVLTALGVPRETVIEDYLLTERYLNVERAMPRDGSAAAWQKLPPHISKAMMGASRQYIEAAFKVIDAHPGGANGYLKDKLGLTPAAIAKLRKLYTA